MHALVPQDKKYSEIEQIGFMQKKTRDILQEMGGLLLSRCYRQP